MILTDYGIIIFSNDLQYLNAFYLIYIVPFLITTVVKLEQPLNISSLITCKFADNIADYKFLQSQNVLLPTSVTESGRTIDSNLEHN